MVNPYTGEITGTSKDKNGTKEFMSTMFSLHRWLLLDKIEKPIIKGVPNKELGSMITGCGHHHFYPGLHYRTDHLVSAKNKKLETGFECKMEGRLEKGQS